MNYEQKYKEALERARDMMSYKEVRREDMEYLFPELKGSEDEKIRKQIISFLKEFEYDHYRSLDFSSWIAWLEKQGEQKSADKVEPKFKVGDWVVYNYPDTIYPVCKIIRVDKRVVDLVSENGSLFQNTLECLNVNYHLWTIQDAKDGDVLAAHESLVLFKEIDGLNIRCYCSLYMGFNPSLSVDTLQNKDAFHPATKEQRDLLFQRIKDEGYEWNADEKVLNKVIIYE